MTTDNRRRRRGDSGNPRPLWRRPAHRAVWKAQRQIGSRAFWDLGGDHRATLYAAGSSRSGTTWLVDVLNYRNRYRYLNEPLAPGKVPSLGHFRWGQYLRPGNRDPIYLEPMKAVLTGQVCSRSLDEYNRNLLARRRLVKDVAANLLLKWLHCNFPNMPIVFIMRHPCAVLTSRLSNSVSASAGFEPQLDRFLAQDDLIADWLMPFRDAIAQASTVLDRQVYWWCIENYVPLRQFAVGELHTINYESLVLEPREEIDRLGDFLGTHFDPSIFTKMRRFSLTTGRLSPLHAGKSAVDNWQQHWSADETRRVMQILSAFGLDEIYTDDPMPRRDGIASLMRAATESPRLEVQSTPPPSLPATGRSR
jgi:Sulfotransferase family